MPPARLPYASLMDLRQLRTLVAIARVGTLSEAAVDLGVSQPAVTRTLAQLESELGVRLVHRLPRQAVPTAAGARVIASARRILAEVENLRAQAHAAPTTLRLGYAWSAAGRRTVPLQRRWNSEHPDIRLDLVRVVSPTAGVAEGSADVALVRIPAPEARFETAVVGVERRLCALAADDPWARRRSLTLAEVATRPVLVDDRTGTTRLELWPDGQRPSAVASTGDVDEWLDKIAAGEALGVTSEATAAHHPRPTVVYRRLRDAPPMQVRLLWWRADPHPAAADLLALLRALYAT